MYLLVMMLMVRCRGAFLLLCSGRRGSERSSVVVRLLQRVKSSKDADTDRNIKGIVWHF